MIKLLYKNIKHNKVLGLLLISIATSFCCYAQEDDLDDIDGLIDELFFEDKKFVDELIESNFTTDFIYTSLSFNSNTYFSGRESGTDQFNLIPQVSYYHSSGFNASVSGIYYQEFEPNWDFTSVYLGYFNTLNENRFIYSLGYTRFFYNDDFDEFTNSIDVSIGVRNRKRTLGSTVAFSYLFGSDTSFQIVANTFGVINLKRTSNLALRLRPNISFIIADQTYTYRDIIRTPLGPRIATTTVNIFDLLNTQLSLPLSLTYNNWDFEMSYNVNLPNAVAEETDLNTTGFFNISVGYLFTVN